MTTFKLKPEPTFKATVFIHAPGEAKPQAIKFTFKHMTRDALKAFQEQAKTQEDEDVILGLAEGWDVVESPFCRDSLTELIQNRIGSASAIVDTYLQEITGTRRFHDTTSHS